MMPVPDGLLVTGVSEAVRNLYTSFGHSFVAVSQSAPVVRPGSSSAASTLLPLRSQIAHWVGHPTRNGLEAQRCERSLRRAIVRCDCSEHRFRFGELISVQSSSVLLAAAPMSSRAPQTLDCVVHKPSILDIRHTNRLSAER
jgi:hypothetical protein